MQWLDTSDLVTDRYAHSNRPTNKSLKQSSFYFTSEDMLTSSMAPAKPFTLILAGLQGA